MENNIVEKLSKMICVPTLSYNNENGEIFDEFHKLLKELFPCLFEKCEVEIVKKGLILKLKGKDNSKKPILLMNHSDVVEENGKWNHSAFKSTLENDKIYGRGTLDDKGPLFAMLEAGNELVKNGFIPSRDIYFYSASNEETTGDCSFNVSKLFKERNISFDFVIDEGGIVLSSSQTEGLSAVIGIGEKCISSVKFIAKSNGGHASTPMPNSPLVRLGKFMAYVDKKTIFKYRMDDIIFNLVKELSKDKKGISKFVMSHPKCFKHLIKTIMKKTPLTRALLGTTIAFTKASGANEPNVIPSEAYVIANIRISNYDNKEDCYNKLRKIASKFDLETEIIEDGLVSKNSSTSTEQFKFVKNVIKNTFGDVSVQAYVMNGASDCKYFTLVSDNCFRFAPFIVDSVQLDSIHGIDENVNVSSLSKAIEFYMNIIKRV